jgi:hypothetical protein
MYIGLLNNTDFFTSVKIIRKVAVARNLALWFLSSSSRSGFSRATKNIQRRRRHVTDGFFYSLLILFLAIKRGKSFKKLLEIYRVEHSFRVDFEPLDFRGKLVVKLG